MNLFRLAIGLFTLLAFQFASATPREFRINSRSADEEFAIAWGVPGKKLDFEKLDQLQHQNNKREFPVSGAVNYLVHMETNSMITPLTVRREDGPFIDARVNATAANLHLHLYLHSFLGHYSEKNRNVIFVMSRSKWYSYIEEVYVLEDVERGVTPSGYKVVAKANDTVEQIDGAIYERLNSAQKEIWSNPDISVAPSYDEDFNMTTKKIERTVLVKMVREGRGQNTGKAIQIEAKFRMEIENQNVKFKLIECNVKDVPVRTD